MFNKMLTELWLLRFFRLQISLDQPISKAHQRVRPWID